LSRLSLILPAFGSSAGFASEASESSASSGDFAAASRDRLAACDPRREDGAPTDAAPRRDDGASPVVLFRNVVSVSAARRKRSGAWLFLARLRALVGFSSGIVVLCDAEAHGEERL
jgi:hypothetical protein